MWSVRIASSENFTSSTSSGTIGSILLLYQSSILFVLMWWLIGLMKAVSTAQSISLESDMVAIYLHDQSPPAVERSRGVAEC